MFREAREFNQNIASWDTTSVEDMEGMFVDAKSFNQDISGWNTPLWDFNRDKTCIAWRSPSSDNKCVCWTKNLEMTEYDMFSGASSFGYFAQWLNKHGAVGAEA